jgi:hypothetical protein
MPAIASLEDLKAAQKEGVSIYAMLYALCSTLYGNGAASNRKMCVEPHRQARCSIFNACVGRHPGQEVVAFCCRGKLWLQERTPEQLKGEGDY